MTVPVPIPLLAGRARSLLQDRIAPPGWRLFGGVLAYSVLSWKLMQPWSGWTILENVLGTLGLLAVLVAALRPPSRIAGPVRRWLQSPRPIHVFAAALALRIGWVLLMHATGMQQLSDFANMNRRALEILHGAPLINPFKPTGPSILFALHYLIVGYHQVAPQITIAVLSALQIAIVYRMVRLVFADRRVATAAAVLLALSPEHICYTDLLGSDVLFSAAILAAVWLLAEANAAADGIAGRFVLGAGLLLGIAHWLRPLAPLYIGAALLYLVGSRRFRARHLASLTVGVLVFVLPMMALNWKVIGSPSPMPSQKGGWSLLFGTNLQTRGRFGKDDVHMVEEIAAARGVPDGVDSVVFQDRVAREIALERIRENPGRLAILIVRTKLYFIWGETAPLNWTFNHSSLEPLQPWAWRVAQAYHWLLVLLAGAFMLTRARDAAFRWSPFAVYLVAGLATTIVLALMEANPRYHHMFIPFCAALAAANLYRHSVASHVEHPREDTKTTPIAAAKGG